MLLRSPAFDDDIARIDIDPHRDALFVRRRLVHLGERCTPSQSLPVGRAVGRAARRRRPRRFRRGEFPLLANRQCWVEFLGFLLLDLLRYFVHRYEHAVPFLWRFHGLHHSDPDVDVTTSVRHHPIEYVLASGSTGSP